MLNGALEGGMQNRLRHLHETLSAQFFASADSDQSMSAFGVKRASQAKQHVGLSIPETGAKEFASGVHNTGTQNCPVVIKS